MVTQNDSPLPATGGSTEPPAGILIVDDQPANLLALEAILGDLGHPLVRAGSGEDALLLMADRDFAVVLLDVRMHGMDGFATARHLRSRDRSRHTPVIFLTANDESQSTLEEAYSLGAVDYLVKPVVPAILRAKVAAVVDLYRRKEQAEREADQLRLLIQGTTDYAIFMLDPAGRVATWNAGAERIKGYAAGEIVGHHFSRFYPQDALDRDWPAEELRRAEAGGRFEDEGWRVRKDGSTFWANVVITALRDRTGGLRGFSKVTRDLSERKKREDELHQLHRDLERRVEDRTAALAASNAALRESDRRKDEWVMMLAHELRNPLAPIRTAVQVIQQPDADRVTVGKAGGMVERQVRHLTRIVDDLLDVSRVQSGKMSLRTERLDLGRLARTVLEDQRAAFERAGVALDAALPELPVWVNADPTRLTQMLDNLLQNAVKFTDRGGTVTLGVEADAGRQRAVLAVRDTGVGIDPDMLPRLFETFAQADRSLDRSKGGLGLGLSLVKGLAELHGGTVEARSEGPGRGAEFVVRLPLQAEPPAVTDVPARPGRAPTRLRVLVVEDNRDAADSLVMLLEVFGYEVTVAYTGPSGVEAAAAWGPDAVVCDIGLPGLDGYGVARALRRNPATAKAHLIAVTGYGGEEDRRLSREAGFDAHLTKPADPTALQDLLAHTGSTV